MVIFLHVSLWFPGNQGLSFIKNIKVSSTSNTPPQPVTVPSQVHPSHTHTPTRTHTTSATTSQWLSYHVWSLYPWQKAARRNRHPWDSLALNSPSWKLFSIIQWFVTTLHSTPHTNRRSQRLELWLNFLSLHTSQEEVCGGGVECRRVRTEATIPPKCSSQQPDFDVKELSSCRNGTILRGRGGEAAAIISAP